MKIDSHQHFWYYNETDFGWIGEEMSVLKRDYLPFELEQELHSVEFEGTIAVQARQKLDETEWLLELAQNNLFIKGVVGWVDLCSPEIEQQLAHFSKHPKLVGVRHVVHDEIDDDFMARPDFQYGISLLEKYKLTYDLLLFPKHLPLACKLVERFPNQHFVLDHIAKPSIRTQLCEPWATHIQALANHQNVYCKLSGMVTEGSWQNWSANDFRFYLETVFNAFGPKRLMIGSDWPVCTVAGNYGKVMNLVIDYLQQFDEETQSLILGENCNTFYFNKLK